MQFTRETVLNMTHAAENLRTIKSLKDAADALGVSEFTPEVRELYTNRKAYNEAVRIQSKAMDTLTLPLPAALFVCAPEHLPRVLTGPDDDGAPSAVTLYLVATSGDTPDDGEEEPTITYAFPAPHCGGLTHVLDWLEALPEGYGPTHATLYKGVNVATAGYADVLKWTREWARTEGNLSGGPLPFSTDELTLWAYANGARIGLPADHENGAQVGVSELTGQYGPHQDRRAHALRFVEQMIPACHVIQANVRGKRGAFGWLSFRDVPLLAVPYNPELWPDWTPQAADALTAPTRPDPFLLSELADAQALVNSLAWPDDSLSRLFPARRADVIVNAEQFGVPGGGNVSEIPRVMTALAAQLPSGWTLTLEGDTVRREVAPDGGPALFLPGHTPGSTLGRAVLTHPFGETLAVEGGVWRYEGTDGARREGVTGEQVAAQLLATADEWNARQTGVDAITYAREWVNGSLTELDGHGLNITPEVFGGLGSTLGYFIEVTPPARRSWHPVNLWAYTRDLSWREYADAYPESTEALLAQVLPAFLTGRVPLMPLGALPNRRRELPSLNTLLTGILLTETTREYMVEQATPSVLDIAPTRREQDNKGGLMVVYGALVGTADAPLADLAAKGMPYEVRAGGLDLFFTDGEGRPEAYAPYGGGHGSGMIEAEGWGDGPTLWISPHLYGKMVGGRDTCAGELATLLLDDTHAQAVQAVLEGRLEGRLIRLSLADHEGAAAPTVHYDPAK